MRNRNFNLQNDPRNEASTSTSTHSEEPFEEYFDKSLIIDESYSEDNSKSFMIQGVNNIEIISPNKDKQGVEKREVEFLKKEYKMLLGKAEKIRDTMYDIVKVFSQKNAFYYNDCEDLVSKKIDNYTLDYFKVDNVCKELKSKLDSLSRFIPHTIVYDTNDDKEFRNKASSYTFENIKDLYLNDINHITCLYYCRQCIGLAKNILSINKEMDKSLLYTANSTYTEEAEENLNLYKQSEQRIYEAGNDEVFDSSVVKSWIDDMEALDSDYQKAVNEYVNLINQLNQRNLHWIRPNRVDSYQNSSYNNLNPTNPLPMMGNTRTQNNANTRRTNMSRGNG